MEYKVVAHLTTKEIKKGVAYDLTSEAKMVHLVTQGEVGKREFFKVDTAQIKALFLVKDFSGNSQYQEKKAFDVSKNIYGTKLHVEFHDGEIMVGTSLSNPLLKKQFFLVPADPDCNNIKILINTDNVKDIKHL